MSLNAALICLNKPVHEKQSKLAFTLIELMAVVIILGILSALMLPRYFRTREKSIDKQAIVALELIRSAERVFLMETGSYFPSSVSDVPIIDDINTNLSLDFVDDGRWQYNIQNIEGFKATLTRAGGWGYYREWSINSTMLNAACQGLQGGSCP